VKGKTNLPYLAGFLFTANPVFNSPGFEPCPLLHVSQHVHHVIVDIICPKPRKLLVKKLIKILAAFEIYYRQFACHKDLFASFVFFKYGAESLFTACVNMGSVKIIHAPFNGAHDQLFCFPHVSTAQGSREAHASETQNRQFIARTPVNPVLQLFLRFLNYTEECKT
jgi:hypothetical protein